MKFSGVVSSKALHSFICVLIRAIMSTSTCERVVENVWDYPRPAILEPIDDEVRIVFNGVEVVKTTNAMRVLETSHPPTYYVPMSEISGSVQLSQVAGGGSYCEWKGRAVYYDLTAHGKTSTRAAWAYPQPTTKVNPNQNHGWANFGKGSAKGLGGTFGPLKDMVAFYATRVDECYVAGERATPQDGGFYGGWVNSWISGGERGIKGAPGTSFF